MGSPIFGNSHVRAASSHPPPVIGPNQQVGMLPLMLEASKGGMKVGRIKDPLYKDSYFGITPPTFIPPFEAPDHVPY